jgi:hypothetical protein
MQEWVGFCVLRLLFLSSLPGYALFISFFPLLAQKPPPTMYCFLCDLELDIGCCKMDVLVCVWGGGGSDCGQCKGTRRDVVMHKTKIRKRVHKNEDLRLRVAG